MKKRLGYILAIGAILVVGYLNYFGNEKEIKSVPKQIETVNPTYKKDGYLIQGDKQIDNPELDESYFEKGIAKLKGMELSGENILLDANKNLAVRENVVGKSESGWKLFSQELNYLKNMDLLYTEKGIRAISEKGAELLGDIFRSDSQMETVQLLGNISLKDGDTLVKAKRAEYSESTKILTLTEDVTLSTLEEGKIVLAHLENAKYNLDTGILYSTSPFTVDYNQVKLFADSFWYDKATQDFKIENQPLIEAGGYKIKIAEIFQKGGSDIVELVGKINATDGKNSFTGESGTYNTGTGILTIDNFSEVSDPNRVFTAKEAIYHRENGDILLKEGELLDKEKGERGEFPLIFGNREGEIFTSKGNIRYYTGNRILKTDILFYHRDSRDVELPNLYTVEDEKGEEVFTGKSGRYTFSDNKFRTPGEVVYKSPERTMTGQELVYDTDTGVGVIERNIRVTGNDGAILTANRARLKREEQMELLGNLKLVQGDNILNSQKGIYNLKDGKFYIPQKLYFTTPEYKGVAEKGSYFPDSKTFLLETVELNSKKGLLLTGDKFTLFTEEKDGKMEISKVVGDESTKTKISNEKATTQITSQSVEAFPKSQEVIFTGEVLLKSVNQKGEHTTGTGEQGFLRGEKKEFELTGNPKVENEKAVLTGDRIIYNMESNKVKALGNVLIDYKKGD
jgi:lipopolysaccharide export system protein LptA